MFLSFLLILKENSRSFVSFTRIDKKQPKTSSKWRRQSDKSSEGGGRGRIEAKQERLFCHLSLATSKEAKQLRHISHLSLAGIKRLNSYDLFATFPLAFFCYFLGYLQNTFFRNDRCLSVCLSSGQIQQRHGYNHFSLSQVPRSMYTHDSAL